MATFGAFAEAVVSVPSVVVDKLGGFKPFNDDNDTYVLLHHRVASLRKIDCTDNTDVLLDDMPPAPVVGGIPPTVATATKGRRSARRPRISRLSMMTPANTDV